MTVLPEPDRTGLVEDALGVLWGKSDVQGTVNLLLQHLLDAAAVAELIWDRFLARSIRRNLDRACDGNGRDIFVLVCALHDIGKASPAFQQKVGALADRLVALGLPTLDLLSKQVTVDGAFDRGRGGRAERSHLWMEGPCHAMPAMELSGPPRQRSYFHGIAWSKVLTVVWSAWGSSLHIATQAAGLTMVPSFRSFRPGQNVFDSCRGPESRYGAAHNHGAYLDSCLPGGMAGCVAVDGSRPLTEECSV